MAVLTASLMTWNCASRSGLSAPARLAVGLQAELLLLQQLADNPMANLALEFVAFSRQPA